MYSRALRWERGNKYSNVEPTLYAMKITNRSRKWDQWYETTYFNGRCYVTYQTKSLTPYHDKIHEWAKGKGYMAQTLMNDRSVKWIGLYAEVIKTTAGKKPERTKRLPASARVNRSMVR